MKSIIFAITLLSLTSIAQAQYLIKIPLEHNKGGALPNGSIAIINKPATVPEPPVTPNEPVQPTDPVVIPPPTTEDQIEPYTPEVEASYKQACARFPNYINPIVVKSGVGQDLQCSQAIKKQLVGLNIMESHAGYSNYNGSNFNNAILTNAFMPYTIFQNASLIGANLNYTYLEGSNFISANLTSASLEMATIYNTNFKNANLTTAKFPQTMILNSNMSGVNLKGADLSTAMISNTDLSNILYDANTKWPWGFVPPVSRDGFHL